MSEKNKFFQAVGRRKTSIASVQLVKGKGKVVINKKEESLPSSVYLEPLKACGHEGQFDLDIRVRGGGKAAQVEAIRLGVSRCLVKFNPDLRSVLKKATPAGGQGGFLTRDARVKERKKPGLKRARRAPQWSKR